MKLGRFDAGHERGETISVSAHQLVDQGERAGFLSLVEAATAENKAEQTVGFATP